MPETEESFVPTVPASTRMASAGKPEVVNTSVAEPPSTPVEVVGNVPEIGANGQSVTPSPTVVPSLENKDQPLLTDEQLTAYFESKGIKYEGIEKLKEKINHTPPAEISAEEKTKQALAKEKRLVDLFISGGGTVDQYVAIKNIAEGDVKELSLNALKKELKDKKFNDEQIDQIIKERYYQISDEELEEQYFDETDREFALRKKQYGAEKLANRSLHTKQQAQKLLSDLTKELESENLQAQEEQTISANIDEQFKAMPRKSTFEIGAINGKAIAPVEFEVSDADLAEVQSTLKDPAKRQQFLYHEDGSLNLTNLSNVLTRNKYLESAVKAAYHEGGSRQVAEFEKVFPARSAQELGVGGSPTRPTGQKGRLASYGKPEIINRPLQHQ